MKKIFLVILLLISSFSFANVFQGCGNYKLRGKLQKDSESEFKTKFVILEKTKAETVFHFETMEEMNKLAPFFNQFTEIKVSILKEMNGTKGIISRVSEVKLSAPNPLNMNEDFLKLSKSECTK